MVTGWLTGRAVPFLFNHRGSAAEADSNVRLLHVYVVTGSSGVTPVSLKQVLQSETWGVNDEERDEGGCEDGLMAACDFFFFFRTVLCYFYLLRSCCKGYCNNLFCMGVFEQQFHLNIGCTNSTIFTSMFSFYWSKNTDLAL